MRIEANAGNVRITLSERNLRVLLAKLEVPTSAKTIMMTDDGGLPYFITAEDDATHYADRTPGVMHPREEAKLKTIENWRERLFRSGKISV